MKNKIPLSRKTNSRVLDFVLKSLLSALLLVMAIPAFSKTPGAPAAPAIGKAFAYTITPTIINNQIANGTDADEVILVVTDAVTGLPVPGVIFAFSFLVGTPPFQFTINENFTTDATGTVTFPITSTSVGSVSVTVTMGGSPIAISPVSLNFIAGPPDPTKSYIVATTATNPADGTSQDVVEAVVNNAVGPVPDGTPVTFTIESGTATQTTTGVTSGGVVYAYYTSNTVGPVQVQAQITGGSGPAYLNDQANPTNNYVTVQFTSPPPVANLSYIVATTATTNADGTSQDVVKAVVNNVNGPVPDGTTVIFTIETGTATQTTTGVTSGGIAYAYYTSTTVGSVQVQAQVTTASGLAYVNDQANPANNYVTVQFTAPVSVTNPSTVLGVSVNNQTADGTSNDIGFVHAVDASGNPVVGAQIVYTVIGGTAAATAIVSPQNGGLTQAFPPGFNFVDITNTQPGTVIISATVNGVPIINGNPATFTFAPPLPVANLSYIVAQTTPMPADGVSQDVVQAVVNSASGPVADGTVVTFTIETGTATMTTTGVTSSGVAYAYFTSTTPGSVQVQAQVTTASGPAYLNDQANPANNFVTIQFTNPPPVAALSYIIAQTTPMPADGTSQDVVQAVVNSASGPVADGTVVTFTILSGTATQTTTGVTSGGIAYGYYTSTTVGSVQVQAQVTTASGPAFLTDQANPANNYVTVQFTNPPPVANLSYIVATTATNPADGTSQDVVEAVVNSAAGPVADGTVVTFTIGSGTATQTTTGVTSGGVVYAYYTSNTVGSVQVQAQITTASGPAYLTDQANPANNYVTVQFTAPPPVANLSYIVATTASTNADGTSQDVVEAVVNNASGPVADGTVVTFTILSGTATQTTTGVTSGGVVYAYYTSNTVGSVQVQAQVTTASGPAYLNDQANPSNNYVTVQFTTPVSTTNPLTVFGVSIDNQPDDGTSNDIGFVHVVDASGNPVVGAQIVYTVIGGTAAATAIVSPQTGGLTQAFPPGFDFVDITNTQPGTVIISATVNGVPILNGNPATFTFVPPLPVANLSYIVAQTTPMPADGVSQDVVQAVVNSASGPVADGTVVTFIIETGTATMTTTGVTSGGVAYAYFTSTTPGSVQVQAQVTTASGPAYLNDQANPANNFVTIQFTSPPPVAALSYIVAQTTPMPADGTSQDVVQAVVNSASGPVADGTVVTFTILSGTATQTTTGVTSGGIAYGYYTSTTVGSVQVQAQVTTASGPAFLTDQANPANNYVTVQFTNPPPVANLSYIVATTATNPADGTSQDVVEAVVNSAAGPVPDGTPVTFTIFTGTATQTTTGVTVGGVVYAYYTSNTVGSVQVQAQITTASGPAYLTDQANPANNYVTVQFTAPPPVANLSYIIAQTTPMPADGTSQDVVEAVVNNASGPVADGTVVTFTILSGTATQTTTGVTSGGIAYGYYTSTTVGSVQVQAQVTTSSGPAFLTDQANPANNFVTIQFTNPPPVANLSYIVATTATNPADGTSQDVVEAVVNSAAGSVPDGTVVTFTIGSGTATQTTTGVTSGGVVYAYYTSNTVGSVQVQAQITTASGPAYLTDQANPANNFVTIQFTPLPDPSLSYIVATTQTNPADGTSQDVVQAYVNNSLGPVPNGTVVTFTIETGTGVITTTGVTNGGVAYAYITSNTVGPVQVQAQITGASGPAFLNDQANPANNYVTVQFTTPLPDPSLSYVVAVTTPMPADGTSQDVVKAVVNNVNGQVPDGTVVTFTIESGTATQTTSGVTSGGIAYAYYTSTTPGNVQVQAQITGASGPAFLNDQGNPANNFVTVVFSPMPDPSLSYIVATTTPVAADGTSQDVVEAVVNNINGPVPNGTPVTFTILTGTATQTTTGVTSGGIAYAYYTSTTIGSVQVQAQITGSAGPAYLNDQAAPANNFVTVKFTPLPDPSLSYILTTTPTMPADGTSKDVVEAVVNNSLGPVPDGTVVTFTILTGTATMTTTGKTVGGIAYAYYTSLTPGAVQVQAKITGASGPAFLNDYAAPSNNYVTVNFTPLLPIPASSYILATTASVQDDGTSQDVVEAVVNNSLGPVPDGTVVTFTIETGTATMTTTGKTVSGIAYAYFTSTTPGAVQVQAQVTGASGPAYLNDQANPTNNYVTVNFTPPTTPPATTGYILATVTPVVADGTSQDVVEAVLTSGGTPVPDGTVVTFTIETGSATMTTTGVTSGGTGIAYAYFTSTTVGSVQVQAQITGGSGSVYLNDQNNSANNYVTIQFITGPPVAGNPGGGGGAGYMPPGGGGLPPTNGGGTGGGSGGGTGGGTISGGIASNGGYTIEFVTRNFQIADGIQQDSVYAYITDANKHPVSNVTVSFFIQTSPSGGTITSGAQFVGSTSISTDANGLAGIGMTSTESGTVWVDATIVDPVSGNTVLIDGSYQILTFDTKPDVTNVLTTLSVIIPQALADGTQQTEVKAHVVDLNGNVMADQEVTFSIDSGAGTILTPQPVETDANGDAYIFITSKTVGTVKIVASVDGEQIVFGSPAPVQFLPINIYVPRVFTPNNDGTNDVLRPILVGISTFHYFTVYNRWGNIVYTTQDPNQGWDGTFKGTPQPVETYLWIAEGIDENGRKIVARGMTSLVR
jgi:adhesin/invasin